MANLLDRGLVRECSPPPKDKKKGNKKKGVERVYDPVFEWTEKGREWFWRKAIKMGYSPASSVASVPAIGAPHYPYPQLPQSLKKVYKHRR
jgi:hypothetical protein